MLEGYQTTLFRLRDHCAQSGQLLQSGNLSENSTPLHEFRNAIFQNQTELALVYDV